MFDLLFTQQHKTNIGLTYFARWFVNFIVIGLYGFKCPWWPNILKTLNKVLQSKYWRKSYRPYWKWANLITFIIHTIFQIHDINVLSCNSVRTVYKAKWNIHNCCDCLSIFIEEKKLHLYNQLRFIFHGCLSLILLFGIIYIFCFTGTEY